MPFLSLWSRRSPFCYEWIHTGAMLGSSPVSKGLTFDTFVDCIDLYYIFRWMGRAGSVHTGSLWTQMILNLRTNTMAVLIITATLGAKNTVTLSTQKFLFGDFVPFWDIFRYVCLDKIIHIFQTQMYLCLWMKNIVYFFPFPYLSMKIKHLAWERGRPPWWWKSKLF